MLAAQALSMIVNARRACAQGVITVLSLCVSVCLCVRCLQGA